MPLERHATIRAIWVLCGIGLCVTTPWLGGPSTAEMLALLVLLALTAPLVALAVRFASIPRPTHRRRGYAAALTGSSAAHRDPNRPPNAHAEVADTMCQQDESSAHVRPPSLCPTLSTRHSSPRQKNRATHP